MDMADPADASEGGGSSRTFTCYTAPGQVFYSEAEMKEHYRSDLHRYNLKRKVAGLAPLTLEAFQEREAREAARQPDSSRRLSTDERRQRREERREQRAASSAKNPNSKTAQYEATREMSEKEFVEHQLSRAPPLDAGSDLFSRHRSPDLHTNLAYMAREHGFYLPYFEYVCDLPGLLRYLQEKVYVGNMALATGKRFHSVEAVQAHMRAKGQCTFALEGNEEEFAPFYDMEAIAAGSPLWEVEEYSEEEEEVTDDEGEGGDDGDGDAPMPSAEGVGALDFDTLCERAVLAGVLTESQVDRLTDAVASGEEVEADLVRRYGALLLQADAGGKASGPASDAMSLTSSVMRRVVYNPLPGSADAASLQLPHKEIGHRGLSRYYKQHFRPASGSVATGSHQLDALLLQYAKAGVLSTHIQKRFEVQARSEVGKKQRAIASKAFVKQGIVNNTTANGMKHYKNQSLNY